VTRRAVGLGAACIAALAMAGCASTPPEQDPVQIKLKDLDTRLARVERVIANQSLLDLSNQLESLRSDVRAMHNDVDQLNHNLDASRKQQHDLYADLDQRLRALEARGGAGPNAPAANPGAAAAAVGTSAAGAGASGGVPPPATPASGDGADKASYQAAFELLKNGQYDAAIAAFQKFLLIYPDSQLADNAQYWLGEAYYVNRSFPEALNAFQHLVSRYPQSRKLPDAMLKIGYCDYELKQWDAAKSVLTQVATNYADTPAGRLAQQRLDKIATERH
jgi:tol-pal system protein YbgF